MFNIWKYLTTLHYKGLPFLFFLSWPHALHSFICTINSDSKVLDVGCGDGNLLKCIQYYKDCNCVGIDLFKLEDTDKIRFFQLDITKDVFPFQNDTFDLIIMNHVMEHLFEVSHMLREINRILKPGGRLYVETPNTRTVLLPSLNFKVEQGMPINFFDDPSHIRPYSELALWHTLKHDFIPIKTAKSRNWFRVVASPFMIAKGLFFGSRRDIFYYTWQLIGGVSYIVCHKKNT